MLIRTVWSLVPSFFCMNILPLQNGFSDPYVKLSIGAYKFTTEVVHKCLNPVWDASFDFELPAP